MPAPVRKIEDHFYAFATPDQKIKLDAIREHGSMTAAAEALKRNKNAVTNAYHQVAKKAAQAAAMDKPPRVPSAELDIPIAPDSEEPIEDLIARKMAQVARAEVSRKFHELITIGVPDNGPVMIAAIGDPHVDSDRCDIGQLLHDMDVIGRTPGMYGLHLGDITDNWVGRLGRLYAHSSTKASDGIRLAEEMFRRAPPLALIGGNHDLWNEGMSWLNFVARQAGVEAQIVQAHGVRLNLTFANGKAVRIHARHDFPGHSQYNPNHGPGKENLFGKRDHIKIAGHKHTDAVSGWPGVDGYVHWLYRVSGYKLMDDYAESINAKEMKMGGTVGLLIDPHAKLPAELVKPFWDLDEGAAFLTWKRARK